MMKSHWVLSGTSRDSFDWIGGKTVDRATGLPLEAVIGEPNYVYTWWLQAALNAARSVARVKLPAGSATGFLVGADLFITNNHVFENEHDAENARLQFNYELNADDTPTARDEWECEPGDLFKTNPTLDYSIVRVKERDGQKVGELWGFFDLEHRAPVVENQRVNIIQHPQGRFKQIAFRDNQVKAVTDTTIQYITDTDYGTSGSPVLDDWFNVIALHNQRVKDPDSPHRWYRNQGYRIQAIVDDVRDLLP